MTKEDAIKILEQVCAAFQGNLAQHQQIQEALKVLKGDDNAVSSS